MITQAFETVVLKTNRAAHVRGLVPNLACCEVFGRK